MSQVHVWDTRIGNLWLAFRVKWSNFCIGFALDWEDTVWLTFRLGPFHFDVAYGDRPHWR